LHFQRLFELANIQYTDFIRTSERRHMNAVHHFWVDIFWYSDSSVYIKFSFTLSTGTLISITCCQEIRVA